MSIDNFNVYEQLGSRGIGGPGIITSEDLLQNLAHHLRVAAEVYTKDADQAAANRANITDPTSDEWTGFNRLAIQFRGQAIEAAEMAEAIEAAVG